MNKDINKYAKKFGSDGGPDPSAAAAKGNRSRAQIRQALRRLAAFQFDVTDNAPPLNDQMRDVFMRKGYITGAEMAAIRKFTQAMKDYRAMENITNDVDGKQIERVVEAKVTLSDLVNGIYEPESSNSEDEELA